MKATQNFFRLGKQKLTLVRCNRALFAEEIRISSKEKKYFFPIKGVPEFKNGLFTVFEYTQEKPQLSEEDNKTIIQKLPQVPYEIKEHALKGFIYTFFLTMAGRLFTNYSQYFWATSYTLYPYIPFSVFIYHFLRPMWYMYNAITAIKLKEDGETVIFEFKNNLQKPVEVEISRIKKDKAENFFYECYQEPSLFPITVDYSDLYSPYKVWNTRKFYIYGDSHKCIKHGEILRAILNSESIKLK